jgi:hypothetical protein
MILPAVDSLWHLNCCCWLCCSRPQMDSVPESPPIGTRTEPRYYLTVLPSEAPLTREPPLQCSAAPVVVRRPRARRFALLAAALGAQGVDDWSQSQWLRSTERVTGSPSCQLLCER